MSTPRIHRHLTEAQVIWLRRLLKGHIHTGEHKPGDLDWGVLMALRQAGLVNLSKDGKKKVWTITDAGRRRFASSVVI